MRIEGKRKMPFFPNKYFGSNEVPTINANPNERMQIINNPIVETMIVTLVKVMASDRDFFIDSLFII